MIPLLSAVATVLLVPPVNLAVLALAALLLAWRRLAVACLVALVLLALPAVAVPLLVALQPPPAADTASAGAIVILGGDVAAGPRPGDEEVGALTLQRLRAGAALQRATRLPILVSGGLVDDQAQPVAALMARSLAADFGVTARWRESASRTTWENARLSAAMLRPEHIGTVLLVTHAWHMRRALIAFRAAGLAAIPAPLGAERWPRLGAAEFVPRASAWRLSYFALHEWLGCAWYAMLARLGPA